MGTETILAIIAAFAIIAAALMAGLAYRLNEKWENHCENFADLLDEQNKFLMKMNREWCEVYTRLAEAKHDE